MLTFAEFVYFLCRVTEVHYENTAYEGEEYWIKLDHMLLFMLDPFELRPAFRYNAKFVHDSQPAPGREERVTPHGERVTVTEYLEEH